jgi:hypothetical protein
MLSQDSFDHGRHAAALVGLDNSYSPQRSVSGSKVIADRVKCDSTAGGSLLLHRAGLAALKDAERTATCHFYLHRWSSVNV